MANFLLALRTALAIIPELINIIKVLEIPGFGPAKLAATVQIVMAALAAVPDELKQIIDATKLGIFVEKVVNIIVAFFNSVGIFKHSE